MDLGLYVSIPFCKFKCTYCNFASGVFPQAELDRYLAALEREIRQSSGTADTVYFGGGTPSMLTPAQWDRLVRTLRERFDLNVVAMEHDGLVTRAPPPDMVLRSGDVVTLDGDLARLLGDSRYTAFLIGPGAGVNDATRESALQILKTARPVLLDADAISVFAS